MSEGRNYYSKPRNFAACIKKSGAIEEVIIFVLWELLVFGPHQEKIWDRRISGMAETAEMAETMDFSFAVQSQSISSSSNS